MKESTFEKHKLVIDEYFVNGFNGTKAYQSVYTDASYATADKGFREIHEIPRIKEYLDQKHKEAQDALRVTHEGILEELRNWAYSDITETILLSTEQVKALPPEIRRLITKYKKTMRHITDKDGNILETIEVIELWFVSKEKAMEMIHKHVGFYEKDNKQKANVEQSKEEILKELKHTLGNNS